MFILDSTVRSLQLKLSGAVATNQLPIVASYVDVTTTAYSPGANTTQTNDATAVDAVAAPAASTQRQVKLLTVRNSDAAPVTLTLQYNDNSTLRIIWSGALAVGDLLIYTDGEGLRVLDNLGQVKQTVETVTPNAAVELGLAVSDETTDLTTGTAKVTFRMPYAMTLTGVRANVNTAPTGSTLIVDINEGGSTILSTKLSIDASEKTSTTAASAAVISDSALADDSEITIDIDQIGSTIAGKGLKIWLIGTRV